MSAAIFWSAGYNFIAHLCCISFYVVYVRCSNNFDLPPSWPLFPNSNECCINVFGGTDCEVEDICATEVTPIMTEIPSREPTTPTPISGSPSAVEIYTPAPMSGSPPADVTSPSSCQSRKWHLHTGAAGAACSNSLTYPSGWDDPNISANFLFNSHSDCCARWSPSNPQSCGRMDDCADVGTTTASTVMANVTTRTTSTVVGDSNNPATSIGSCLSGDWHITRDYSK